MTKYLKSIEHEYVRIYYYSTFSNIKLHWKDHASHVLSILNSDPFSETPRLMYPDCFDSLRTLSLLDLSVAIAADVKVSFPLNF